MQGAGACSEPLSPGLELQLLHLVRACPGQGEKMGGRKRGNESAEGSAGLPQAGRVSKGQKVTRW